MNLRHAAALALVGWYLMAPPPNQNPNRPQAVIDGTAPLSKWWHLDEFDTAKECKTVREQGREQAKHSGIDTPDRAKELLYAQRTLSECIATDDPRLKGN